MRYLTLILLFVWHTASGQLYENYFNTAAGSTVIAGAEWRGQTFTVGTVGSNLIHSVDSIAIYGWLSSGGSDEMVFEIKAVDGGGLPTGAALSASGNINVTGWSGSADWHYVAMSAYELQPSTKYALIIHTVDATGIRWAFDIAGSYTGGSFVYSGNSGSTWTAGTDYDYLFRIYGTYVSSGYSPSSFRMSYRGTELRPGYGTQLDPGYDPTNPEGDTIHYYFYDDFESWTTASVSSYDSLMGRLPINGFFMPAQQAILDVGGSHGKVWDSHIPTGGETSLQLTINLGDTTSEALFEYDFMVEESFSNAGQGGVSSHKFPGGFYAGDNIDDALVDSTNVIGGKASWGGLVSQNAGDYLMAYPFYQPEDGNWGGHATGDSGVFQLPYGEWIRVTYRMKINRVPGKYDGFIEVYRDGTLVIRYGILKSRSVAQGANYGKIEQARFMYFFGAYPRSSTRENHIYIDNIVVYKYKPGAMMFNYGLNTFGGQVPPTIMPPASSKKPVDLLADETYTAVTDTIFDVGNGKGYLAWPPYKNAVVTKEVTLPSGTINYTFLAEQFGYDWPYNCSYVKVYSGTGVGKTLLATYGRASGCGYTDPSGTYSISDNEATFEIYSGSTFGYTKGVAIRYWQP